MGPGNGDSNTRVEASHGNPRVNQAATLPVIYESDLVFVSTTESPSGQAPMGRALTGVSPASCPRADQVVDLVSPGPPTGREIGRSPTGGATTGLAPTGVSPASCPRADQEADLISPGSPTGRATDQLPAGRATTG